MALQGNITNISGDDRENKYINILLLGESGVGKSTFINSFANYLQYPCMTEALSAKLCCLISAKFTVTTDDNEQKTVLFGNDDNEDKQVGNSSTQSAKAYVFPLDTENWIRLIDTPGIGDARGTIQDRKNLENILDHIAKFTHLHAICFLLKPNVTVINPYFKFCIMELLSRLDRSASNNIVFIFTNTRGSDYKAVDTLTNIKRILKDLETQENVKIPLNYTKDSSNNVFCFDNEGFKYLVAAQQNIKYGNPEVMTNSWDISCTASWALIKYIRGDENQKALVPHKVQNTVSVNEARRLIIELSKPLADINELIQDNLSALERHKEKVLQENLSTEELKKVLSYVAIDIKQTNLQQPVTICTASKCSEIHTLLGIKKYHYKQRCHNPCYLRQVPQEIIGSPEIMHCNAMLNRKCQMCGCDFSTHMHIYYETEYFETELEDNSVKLQIETNVQRVKAQYDCIQKLQKASEDYQKEYLVISKSMAKFAYFLKHNSICPINDAYEEYLEYLIQREKFVNGDANLLKRYQSLKSEHLEQKHLLENASKTSEYASIKFVTSSDIINTIKELYKLDKMGPRIRDLHIRQEAGSQREHKKNMEYVHNVMPKKPGAQGGKPKNNVQNPKKQNKKIRNVKEQVTSLLESNRLDEALDCLKALKEESDSEQKTKEKHEQFVEIMSMISELMKGKQPGTSNSNETRNRPNRKQKQDYGNQFGHPQNYAAHNYNSNFQHQHIPPQNNNRPGQYRPHSQHRVWVNPALQTSHPPQWQNLSGSQLSPNYWSHAGNDLSNANCPNYYGQPSYTNAPSLLDNYFSTPRQGPRKNIHPQQQPRASSGTNQIPSQFKKPSCRKSQPVYRDDDTDSSSELESYEQNMSSNHKTDITEMERYLDQQRRIIKLKNDDGSATETSRQNEPEPRVTMETFKKHVFNFFKE